MRVVLLNQYYAPADAATAQILADLGQGLARAGHEVVAVCSRRAYSDPGIRYGARDRIDGVEVRRTWTTGFGRGRGIGRLIDYLTFFLGATRVLATQRRPDAVISLSTPPLVALLGLTLARLRGASSLYWVMDVYPQLAFELGVIEPRSMVGRIFRSLSATCLRRSDEVIALGDTMAERLASEGAGTVTVIHNWADGEAIHPVEPLDNPLRAEWGWSDRFVVLYSGNMGLAHEFDTILDAAERLADDPRILLAFVGGGPRRAEVEAEVRRRGLSNVEFLPYVAREQLGNSLTAGDVHLVTLRERMPGLLVPSKIYGILAAGRPSVYVGPQQGEIADILTAGRCGVGVRGGDADALAEAIRGYANDPARTREHGANARRSFELRFTREHGVDAFRELLDRACDGRRSDETVQGRVAGR